MTPAEEDALFRKTALHAAGLGAEQAIRLAIRAAYARGVADEREARMKVEEERDELKAAAIALESAASKRLRFRDNERHPELCAALVALRTAIEAAREGK